jgi:ABC-type dipeptide/oligopeptide/nickel transport system permease component
VVELIGQNLPYTIELTLVATGMGLVAGLPLGVWAAVNRNRPPTRACACSRSSATPFPDFYLGALLLIAFALQLGWFPINGGGRRVLGPNVPRRPAGPDAGRPQGRLHRPADAGLALESLGKDYVRTARAKGARESRVLTRHALRNALLPVATGLG